MAQRECKICTTFYVLMFGFTLAFSAMTYVNRNSIEHLKYKTDGITGGIDRVAVSVNRLEATSGEAIIQLLEHAAKLEKRVAELERINAEQAGVGAAEPGDTGEPSGGVNDQAADLQAAYGSGVVINSISEGARRGE